MNLPKLSILCMCTALMLLLLPAPVEAGKSTSRGVAPWSDRNEALEPGCERFDYPLKPAAPGEPLVVLTISGGGSRSAYYAARVMEEMSRIKSPSGKHSLLDSVRVISTVSAGSLAAAWYLVHFDERHQPDFFERFKKAMSVNLQWRTYGHMAMFPPLALQLAAPGVTRTDLLANEMEDLVGSGTLTFDHLRARETRTVDPAPAFIINGTVYNSGQRLVMTNLPPRRFPSLLSVSDDMVYVSDNDEIVWRNLVQPLTFEDFGSNIGSFRLANAVAASAAFPIVLAPTRLKVFSDRVSPALANRSNPDLLKSEYIYVADGGLYENEGVDAVLSLVRTLDRNQPVLVIIIEASQRMETVKAPRNKIWDPITVIYRMYDIGTMRPLAFYNTVVKQFHSPDKFGAVMIRMEGYDEGTDKTLRNIPTSFRLTRRHRDALDAAATENVAHMKDELLKTMRALSGAARRAR